MRRASFENPELCYGHVKFEYLLNIQIELLSRQLNVHLELRGTILAGDKNLDTQ